MKVRGNLYVSGGFVIQIAHFRDERAAGVDSDTLTPSAWNTRTLNTVAYNGIAGASLSSNRVTLPTGRYFIQGTCPYYDESGIARARIYNTTDSTAMLVGPTIIHSNDIEEMTLEIPVRGIIVSNGSAVIELQHYAAGGGAPAGGDAGNIVGVNEVYSELIIWRV